MRMGRPLPTQSRNIFRFRGGADIPCEFRTTCAAPLVHAEVIEAIARRIKGARRYVLQPCIARNALDPAFFQAHPDQPSHQDLSAFQALAAPFVKSCIVR